MRKVGWKSCLLTQHRQSCQQRCVQTPAQIHCCQCTRWLHAGMGREQKGIPTRQTRKVKTNQGFKQVFYSSSITSRLNEAHMFKTRFELHHTLAAFPTRGFSGLYSSLKGRATCRGEKLLCSNQVLCFRIRAIRLDKY